MKTAGRMIFVLLCALISFSISCAIYSINREYIDSMRKTELGELVALTFLSIVFWRLLSPLN